MDSEATNLSGKFLIALPSMGDPRFKQTVIYMCSHDASGAMGLIINKPKPPFNLSDMLSQIGINGDIRFDDPPLLNGGPVDADRGFVLHSPDYFSTNASLILSESLSLTATRDVLEALVSDQAPRRAVLLIGYSGWGPGQIEQEIVKNAWITVEAQEDLIFDTDIQTKWERAIASLGITPDKLSHEGGRA